ncbi:MAG TPA: hypothetical protein PK879_05060 [Opitutaceae bacterium]|nr:hypothetical protein [Opitutaceae bacterium]HOD47018.1 hypothetical protein [Opitutaceae bacterium]HOY53496.1 hypothetical protein [Opitutaceae bacterium]HPG16531.1 hypothetical protein [Opitutaceae bacterium]HPO00064.1 hypothetical protein [Opitutaceae bacterium]
MSLEKVFLFLAGWLPFSQRSIPRDIEYLRNFFAREGLSAMASLPDGFFLRLSTEAFSRAKVSGKRVTIGAYTNALNQVAIEVVAIGKGRNANEGIRQIVEYWSARRG